VLNVITNNSKIVFTYMSKVKTYWKGFEEKEQTSEFLEATQNEFTQNLPTTDFLGNSKLEETSTPRRDFLKFMGFSVAAATLAACEAPVIKSIPYVNKPEEITPGVANWYASTYWDGNDYASILIKTREARPIFVKGNKDFGINNGAVTPRITASVLSLYNGARLKNPTVNGESSTWAKVDSQIGEKLKDIKAKGGSIRILTNTIASPSTKKALGEFVQSLGGTISEDGEVTGGANVEVITYDAISYTGLLKANKASFGRALFPDYHFNKAKTIVSIGADFLTNWGLSTDYVSDYAENRRPEGDWMSRHFQFESVVTTSGTSADVRIPIKPSEEGLVVAALYKYIVGPVAVDVTPSIMSKTEKVAQELKASKGKALVVAGKNCEGTQLLVNEINKALGAIGNTVDPSNGVYVAEGDDTAVEKLVNEVNGGKVDALLLYGVNPVYTLPNGNAFGDSLKKINLTVSFSQFADETASKCQFVCPDNHFMESWNDYQIKDNHYAIAQPVIRPLYDTAQAQETFLVWAGKAKRGGKDSTVYYNYIKSSFAGDWNSLVHNGSVNAAPLMPFVNEIETQTDLAKVAKHINSHASEKGEFEVVFYQKNAIGAGEQAANPWLQELPDPITKVTWDNYITISRADAIEKGLTTDNGGGIILGEKWPADLRTIKVNGQELTLPLFVLPGQAKGTLGIPYGYGRGENQENIGDAAYQTKEYGNYVLDENGNKTPIGKNAFKLTTFKSGLVSNAAPASLSGSVGQYPLACTQTHHTFMGRTSIVRETTFDVFKHSGKEAYNPEHTLVAHEKGKTVKKNIREFDLWEDHPVENVGHRWGLSIDLSSCIGCGNCVVACHAENNVPVVGKDEIRRGRDMHWLRIDRYFSSDEQEIREISMDHQSVGFQNVENEKDIVVFGLKEEEKIAEYRSNDQYKEITDFSYLELEVPEAQPTVVYMPVMCQHCNHAPCETVCPVVATTHSNEGLNQMTYNRCIGTRYCANNCPYKVRRFNWFNYPTNDRFVHFNPSQMDMGRMVLNPDVTVRARGVMEKCSMCVQQIQAGKLEAKKAGKPVQDGAIQTACSTSCPTEAITFGDLNDFKSHEGKGSKIRQQADNDRAYHILEEVGTQPNIYYQVKVSNRTEAEA